MDRSRTHAGVYEKQRKLTPEDVEAVRTQLAMGIPAAEVARRYSISRRTFFTATSGRGTYAA